MSPVTSCSRLLGQTPQRPRRFPPKPAGKWPVPRCPSPAPVGAEGRPRLRTAEPPSGWDRAPGRASRRRAEQRLRHGPAEPPVPASRERRQQRGAAGRDGRSGGGGGRWREVPPPAPLPAREVNAGPPTAGRGGAGRGRAGGRGYQPSGYQRSGPSLRTAGGSGRRFAPLPHNRAGG